MWNLKQNLTHHYPVNIYNFTHLRTAYSTKLFLVSFDVVLINLLIIPRGYC